jgi:cell division protease FtsH
LATEATQPNQQILKVHIKGYKLSKNVNLEDIAKMTAGLAGADLANIVNEAALLAGRANKKEIEQSDFLEAIERAIAGLEKKSRRIDEKEKRIVCYHESGHALIAEVTEGAKKVKKVSVVPRGMAALGYTLNTPEENKYLMQKHELMAEIDTLLGGRAAEEVFIKEKKLDVLIYDHSARSVKARPLPLSPRNPASILRLLPSPRLPYLSIHGHVCRKPS